MSTNSFIFPLRQVFILKKLLVSRSKNIIFYHKITIYLHKVYFSEVHKLIFFLFNGDSNLKLINFLWCNLLNNGINYGPNLIKKIMV